MTLNQCLFNVNITLYVQWETVVFLFDISIFQLHVVHFKEEYNTTSEAIKHSDGLAVMAFFFEV